MQFFRKVLEFDCFITYISSKMLPSVPLIPLSIQVELLYTLQICVPLKAV